MIGHLASSHGTYCSPIITIIKNKWLWVKYLIIYLIIMNFVLKISLKLRNKVKLILNISQILM